VRACAWCVCVGVGWRVILFSTLHRSQRARSRTNQPRSLHSFIPSAPRAPHSHPSTRTHTLETRPRSGPPSPPWPAPVAAQRQRHDRPAPGCPRRRHLQGGQGGRRTWTRPRWQGHGRRQRLPERRRRQSDRERERAREIKKARVPPWRRAEEMNEKLGSARGSVDRAAL